MSACDFFSSSFTGVSKEKIISFVPKEEARKGSKFIKWKERRLKRSGDIQKDEAISGVLIEKSSGLSIENLCESLQIGEAQVEVDRNVHSLIKKFLREEEKIKLKQVWATSSNHIEVDLSHSKASLGHLNARVDTKYKTVDKKVRPAATPLPEDARELLKKASEEPSLRDPAKIGHKFTEKTIQQLKIGGEGLLSEIEEAAFRKMLLQHSKAFSFSLSEIGCVNPKEVTPMVIFTVPHIPWDLKPLSVPRALLPKLVELLKEKLDAHILERSNAPYSNRWFTIRKKNGKLRFIQDMQPPNRVTIRNVGTGPVVDEFAEEFAGKAIYSIGDLYSGYDQFQLAESSRDITTMRTPLGLLKMCTLPMGATNSVAHMQNAMNKVLHEFIPAKTRPFLDDIPIKGCNEGEKDTTLRPDGLRQFVGDHMEDVAAILKRLIDARLTLSGEKSAFGQYEIMVVGQLCGPYGRLPSREKINAIILLKDCNSVTEVRRFLGACVFYRIWIPHFAHIAEPLYNLLRKSVRFTWLHPHGVAMTRLKQALLSSPVLRTIDYNSNRPIIVTVDSSPTATGWAVGQDDEQGNRFATRFGAKIFNERQRRYPQVKRELWGAKIALKQEKDFLIGAHVILETDCLPLLGMIANCNTPDIAMLRWIAFIHMINPELRHIAGKDNPVADMLSRARYRELDEDDIGVSHTHATEETLEILEFKEDLYSGELLLIGKYLSTLEGDESWTQEDFKKIRKKSYGFLLKEGFLWKRPRKRGHVPLRVVDTKGEKLRILQHYHDSDMAGHKGVQSTYEKIQELYWWRGIYKDVRQYVETCEVCQLYSKIRHRDELHPTHPLYLHFQWVLDIVHMPRGVRGTKYLVLAREDLSSYVEGRALTTNTTEAVCRFVLEDIIARHGFITQLRADRGELESHKATDFFKRFNIKLKLTTAYNPEANGKSERGHPPIVNALIKSCDGEAYWWPDKLPLALLADRLTCNSVTGRTPAELVCGHLPLMPIEEDIASWRTIEWKDNISTEDLLAKRMEHFDQTPAIVATALEKLKASRIQNKVRFDKTHRLRPTPIKEGDWVLIFNDYLLNQHATIKKFALRWRGPFVVVMVHPNATYTVRELDGAIHSERYAGKRVKLFKRRTQFQDGEDIMAEADEDLDYQINGGGDDA